MLPSYLFNSRLRFSLIFELAVRCCTASKSPHHMAKCNRDSNRWRDPRSSWCDISRLPSPCVLDINETSILHGGTTLWRHSQSSNFDSFLHRQWCICVPCCAVLLKFLGLVLHPLPSALLGYGFVSGPLKFEPNWLAPRGAPQYFPVTDPLLMAII